MTNTNITLKLARKLRNVMVDRSGDDNWALVPEAELVCYLADSYDIEESADIVESYSLDPASFGISAE